MRAPAPVFDHLLRLTDDGGLFEHARGTEPRFAHGYCVDDVARALALVCREPEPTPVLRALQDQYLGFVLDAQVPDGRFRNRRRSSDLRWAEDAGVEDCWGRALGGLGAAVLGHHDPDDRARALAAFEAGARHRSPHARATAYAALGAADVLSAHPGHTAASDLLADAAAVLRAPRAPGGALVRGGPAAPQPDAPQPDAPEPDAAWPWPEARLTYANAAVADVLVAAGADAGDEALLAEGLALLQWLLDVQTRDGHLSLVPVGGLGPTAPPDPAHPDPARGGAASPYAASPHPTPPDGAPLGLADQQPLEAALLAEACARAAAVTADPRWERGVDLAVAWFLGDNDAATPLYDPVSGGGCDGLEATGRNENQGAESTLAVLSTFQVAHRAGVTA